MRVSIEDAYTGSVVVVDNVPLGPAVVGSVMSNMGYRTTRLFEQGFGTPSMTGNGCADSLQTLTAVRKNLLSRINLGAANVCIPQTGAQGYKTRNTLHNTYNAVEYDSYFTITSVVYNTLASHHPLDFEISKQLLVQEFQRFYALGKDHQTVVAVIGFPFEIAADGFQQ